MPDMYDKLGELLNEALKSGKIPQEEKKPLKESEAGSQTQNESLKQIKLPKLVQLAAATLGLNWPFSLSEVKKQYHGLLKQTHPDTNYLHVQKNAHSIDDLKAAYEILCLWCKKKSSV